MTSNRPLEDWGKLIGDVPAATAILDRFLHNAEVITITGKSYRLRNRSPQRAAACDRRDLRRGPEMTYIYEASGCILSDYWRRNFM